jgi:hypothetical protein
MKSNIVSPEPDRTRRKTAAVVKLARDILQGRKTPSEALREYQKTADEIRREKALDKWIKY